MDPDPATPMAPNFEHGRFLVRLEGRFPVQAWNIRCQGAQRRGWEEQSHREPRAAPYSEHGEDGEHRTFPGIWVRHSSSALHAQG
jgi:hypothetical protein